MSILTKDQVTEVVELYNIKKADDTHDAAEGMLKDVLVRVLKT